VAIAQRKNKRTSTNNKKRLGKVVPKRRRNGLWIGISAALVGAFLLWNGSLIPSKETAAAAAMLQAPLQPAKTSQSFANTDFIEGSLQVGETLSESLRARGLSSLEIDTISGALRQNFDFRFTRTGDTYRMLRNQKTGQITSFSYQRSPAEVYSLSMGADQRLQASQGEIASGETRQLTLTIEGSLRKTLQGREDGENLARLLSAALSWQLDLHNVSSGTLTLVVEKSWENATQPYQKLLAVRYQKEKKELFALWYTDPEGHSAYVDAQGRTVRRDFLRAPLQLVPVAQTTHTSDLQQYWAAPGTPVLAVSDGEIEALSEENGVYSLVLRHTGGVRSTYENIAQLAPGIKRGVLVNQQRLLGTIGKDANTPAMLSFHVEREGVVIELGGLTQKGTLLAKNKEHFAAFSTRMMSALGVNQ
jgi:murein DD-endopeptidase MepM/ murein hydrolase activator NlpD